MRLPRKVRKWKFRVEEAIEDIRFRREKQAKIPETDLISHMDLIELLNKAVTPGKITFIPQELKIYSDRIWMKLAVAEDMNEDTRTAEITAPYTEGAQYVPFVLEGQELRWDMDDATLRYDPVFDPAVEGKINPWVSILDSRVIRVEREYALHNLSEKCLAYAFRDNGDSYDWCIQDHSTGPVVFELNPIFWQVYDVFSETYLSPHWQDLYQILGVYASSYCRDMGLTVDGFLDACLAQKARHLWEPEN